jgi:organic hydroperoxide reductase OsmC/OhrA
MVAELTKRIYTAQATAVGGRAGHVKSSDGLVDVDLGGPGRGREEERRQH